jgi:hypothetical protein
MLKNKEKEGYEKYTKLFEQLAAVCDQYGFGDFSSYARSKEIYMAAKLGHRVAKNFSGADAESPKGEVEYKSTTQKKLRGTYSGISVQSTWAEQERYLRNDKIGKYKEHYFGRFDKGILVECWMLTDKQVLKFAIPLLKATWKNRKKRPTKDPRLAFQITEKYIKENGVRVI